MASNVNRLMVGTTMSEAVADKDVDDGEAGSRCECVCVCVCDWMYGWSNGECCKPSRVEAKSKGEDKGEGSVVWREDDEGGAAAMAGVRRWLPCGAVAVLLRCGRGAVLLGCQSEREREREGQRERAKLGAWPAHRGGSALRSSGCLPDCLCAGRREVCQVARSRTLCTPSSCPSS